MPVGELGQVDVRDVAKGLLVARFPTRRMPATTLSHAFNARRDDAQKQIVMGHWYKKPSRDLHSL